MEEIEPYPYELKLLDKYPNGTDPQNPIRIYTDGVFDCFHYGHARLFQKVKLLLPHVHLIIGVCKDEDIIQEKAKPIMNLKERMESAKHCRWVDEVVVAPWVPTNKFLDSINAHYLAHDPEPYPYQGMADCYSEIKEAGRFISTTRTDGISTTDIIVKIIEDYDIYVERSIKKKVPIESLHLSASKWLKYESISIANLIKKKLLEVSKEVYEKDNSKTLVKQFIEEQEKSK